MEEIKEEVKEEQYIEPKKDNKLVVILIIVIIVLIFGIVGAFYFGLNKGKNSNNVVVDSKEETITEEETKEIPEEIVNDFNKVIKCLNDELNGDLTDYGSACRYNISNDLAMGNNKIDVFDDYMEIIMVNLYTGGVKADILSQNGQAIVIDELKYDTYSSYFKSVHDKTYYNEYVTKIYNNFDDDWKKTLEEYMKERLDEVEENKTKNYVILYTIGGAGNTCNFKFNITKSYVKDDNYYFDVESTAEYCDYLYSGTAKFGYEDNHPVYYEFILNKNNR